VVDFGAKVVVDGNMFVVDGKTPDPVAKQDRFVGLPNVIQELLLVSVVLVECY
jgi:hypothetical protein